MEDLQDMGNLQVKNIPDTLHDRLRTRARENRSTVSATVLAAVERDLAMWEWQKSFTQHPEADLGIDAATLIREGRTNRDFEIGE